MLIKKIKLKLIQSILYKSTIIIVSLALMITIIFTSFAFSQDIKKNQFQLEEKNGYYFKNKETVIFSKNTIFQSRNKAVFAGISENFVTASLAGLAVGGIAALITKNKKDVFRNWTIGIFAFSFPINLNRTLKSIDKKTIVKFKGNWISPEKADLMKYNNFWFLKSDIIDFFWKEVNNEDTIKSYDEFLELYPVSKYSDQARKRLKELYFKNAEETGNYEKFLNKYKFGKLADEARKRIKELKNQQNKERRNK